MLRLLPFVVAVLVAALLSGGHSSRAVDDLASPPTVTLTVWHWNVAGAAMHHGSTDDGLVDVAVASILDRGADLVSLNELCRQQYQALRVRLGAAGWAPERGRSSAFQPTTATGHRRCHGQASGIALFSVTPIASVDRFLLPDDGSAEHRALLCAAVGPPVGVRFCVTHITTKSSPSPRTGLPANVAQLRFVLDRLEAYDAAGETALIAGDFNAQPDYTRLDSWYSAAVDTPANGGNTGHYRELDDDDPEHCPGYGEWTASGAPGASPPCAGGGAECAVPAPTGCGKVDLVFVRENRIAGRHDADSLAIATTCRGIPARPAAHVARSCSDHRVLVGTVTVREAPG